MAIKYPDGSVYQNQEITKTIKPVNKSKGHLGLNFESEITKSCEYYIQKNIALIYKKPTPIQVVKTSFPERRKAKITEAFYRIPSTTDYNGIYKGNYIDFEAKSCSANTFGLDRIYPHQIEHLKKVKDHGGIAFLIIEFTKYDKTFIYDIDHLYELYKNSLNGGRKSIVYTEFLNNGIEVEKGYLLKLDFLKAVECLKEKYYPNLK